MSSSILLPFRQEPTRAFAELARDPAEQRRIAVGLTRSVVASFAEDQRRAGPIVLVRSGHEERRRLSIAIELFGQLRYDMGYSVAQALDEVPNGLRAAIDGTSYEPPKRDRMWAANG